MHRHRGNKQTNKLRRGVATGQLRRKCLNFQNPDKSETARTPLHLETPSVFLKLSKPTCCPARKWHRTRTRHCRWFVLLKTDTHLPSHSVSKTQTSPGTDVQDILSLKTCINVSQILHPEIRTEISLVNDSKIWITTYNIEFLLCYSVHTYVCLCTIQCSGTYFRVGLGTVRCIHIHLLALKSHLIIHVRIWMKRNDVFYTPLLPRKRSWKKIWSRKRTIRIGIEFLKAS